MLNYKILIFTGEKCIRELRSALAGLLITMWKPNMKYTTEMLHKKKKKTLIQVKGKKPSNSLRASNPSKKEYFKAKNESSYGFE